MTWRQFCNNYTSTRFLIITTNTFNIEMIVIIYYKCFNNITNLSLVFSNDFFLSEKLVFVAVSIRELLTPMVGETPSCGIKEM